MVHFARVSTYRVAVIAGLALLILSLSGNAILPATASSSGGTVKIGENPGVPPDYILPLESGPYFTGSNEQVSNYMYPPLYWYGTKGLPTLNTQLSLANPAKFSNDNETVTINLKHWGWSNGQPITGRDVVFWINLLKAAVSPAAANVGSSNAPGPGWGSYVPGGFPDNVVSDVATSTYQVVLHLNKSYNPLWFAYNELSQIFPLPQAQWDRLSASGPVGNYDMTVPGTATTGALGVAQFLNEQSQDLSTYTSNPLWQVVDGPFRLKSFTSEGYVSLVPNSEYSGSDKAKVAQVDELPFTSDTAEFDELRAGQLTIGLIPPTDLGQRGYLESHGYSYAPYWAWGFNYFAYNFTNSKVGPIFKQLYFRQALQSLIDQPQYIDKFTNGIGSVGNGPVPAIPKGNPFVSPLEAHGQVYPYDAARAVKLLKAHGWDVHPGGVTTCVRPGTSVGECGSDITAGTRLSFTLPYPSGSTVATDEMGALQSAAKQLAGISLAVTPTPISVISDEAFAGCTDASPCNDWQLISFATTEAWGYYPDFLPTGEDLFLPGSSANIGYYSNPTNTANIDATLTAPTYKDEIADLYRYENYLARQLPVAYLPLGAFQLWMYKSALKGVVPISLVGVPIIQNYHFA
jgi:peptide/nickel transport system substrate-binding protein